VWPPDHRRTIRGRVVDQNGNPVPDAIVQADWHSIWVWDAILLQTGVGKSATTDASGRYELSFRWKKDEEFELGAAHPDFVAAAVTVPLAPPGEARTVDLVLRRGKTIEGRMLDGAGSPIRDAPVWLQPEGAQGPDDTLRQRGRTFTDADGRFRFGPRAPGRYRLMTPEFGVPTMRTVEPGAVVELRPEHAGEIAGRMFESRSGWSVVLAVPRGTSQVAATAHPDPAGRFVLRNLEPGRYDLVTDDDRIWKRDVATGSTGVELRPREGTGPRIVDDD